MTAPVQVGSSSADGGPTPISSAYVTRRERQVLVLAANGTPNKTIGSRLGITEDTVKTNMRSILRKLRAKDRAQASTVALRLGLIGLEDISLPGDLANRAGEDR